MKKTVKGEKKVADILDFGRSEIPGIDSNNHIAGLHIDSYFVNPLAFPA